MLINTNNIKQVDGVGVKIQKDIEEYYKNISWWERLLGGKQWMKK